MLFFLQSTPSTIGEIVGQWAYFITFGNTLLAGLLLFLVMAFIFWKLKLPLSISAFLSGALIFALGMPIPGFNSGIPLMGGVLTTASFLLALFGFIAVGFGLYYLLNRG